MVKDVVERAPYVKITLTPIIRFTDNDVLLKYQHELTKFLHLNRRDIEMDFETTIECRIAVRNCLAFFLINALAISNLGFFEMHIF